jgi:DNA adenine methylase
MRYHGGKNQSGTFQRIINIIPVHDIYIELFAGSAAIYNNIDGCSLSILIDINPKTCENLRNNALPGAIIKNIDALQFLQCSVDLINFLHDTTRGVFIYCDPPYPFSVRRSTADIYKFEMRDPQHVTLLKLLQRLNCYVTLSSYKNKLYDDNLKSWNFFQFYNQTRVGKALECVYYNFELSGKLHDYSYIGNDFRQRAAFKIASENFISKFKNMPVVLQNSIIDKLNL